jgi:hypothetical protein
VALSLRFCTFFNVVIYHYFLRAQKFECLCTDATRNRVLYPSLLYNSLVYCFLNLLTHFFAPQ